MLEKLDQRTRRIQIASVGPEVDAGQRDFLETGGGDTLDLAEQVVDRDAARPSAGRGNDAVRARLGAAGLNAQSERGPPRDARLEGRAAWAVATPENRRRARKDRRENIPLSVLHALRSLSVENGQHPRLAVIRNDLHHV